MRAERTDRVPDAAGVPLCLNDDRPPRVSQPLTQQWIRRFSCSHAVVLGVALTRLRMRPSVLRHGVRHKTGAREGAPSCRGRAMGSDANTGSSQPGEGVGVALRHPPYLRLMCRTSLRRL